MLLDMNILQKYVTYRMLNIILYEKLKEINHLHQMIITQKFLFLSPMQNDHGKHQQQSKHNNITNVVI